MIHTYCSYFVPIWKHIIPVINRKAIYLQIFAINPLFLWEIIP